MSVMGTGVAAGVAQTALQSQQQARKRDKKIRDDQQTTQKVLEVFEAHIQGLEENDSDEESSARLHVDSEVRDHEDLIDDAPAKIAKRIKDETKAAAGASDIADLSAEAQRIALGDTQDPNARQLLSNLSNQPRYTTPPPPETSAKPITNPQPTPAATEIDITEDTTDQKPPYKHLDIKA